MPKDVPKLQIWSCRMSYSARNGSRKFKYNFTANMRYLFIFLLYWKFEDAHNVFWSNLFLFHLSFFPTTAFHSLYNVFSFILSLVCIFFLFCFNLLSWISASSTCICIGPCAWVLLDFSPLLLHKIDFLSSVVISCQQP